jgi:radical SAM/CxCxxxxC motif protein YfkAB
MNHKQIHSNIQKCSPQFDPWDPIRSLEISGNYQLTGIELTMTNLCNMRCEHCAVGDSLTVTEGARIPLAQILKRLDEVEHLQTISITGGEPSYHEHTVREYILPILQYARDRGIYSQLNSNLTLDLARYEMIAPFLDVMHISYNYVNAHDFYEVGFVHRTQPLSEHVATRMYEQMVHNAIALSRSGLFISAETMINFRTHEKLPDIHQQIVNMGCRRHEVHPMYPSAFASSLPMLSLHEMRTAIHHLLDSRHPELWMLFGTLPFFACSKDEADQQVVERLWSQPNVTIRNDPDGRNRLNVNVFTGDVYVTDFANVPPLGNMHTQKLDDVFRSWLGHPLTNKVNCYCPSAQCCGPNLLVADMYYREENFKQRKALISNR